MTKLIFWDVDTLYDFMKSDGKLYVPGSEDIIPAVKALTDFAHANRIPIVASADNHELSDPEISDTASNHASVAILAGVPAISTGVAPCGKSHSVDEVCEIEPIYAGIKRNIVLAVALSE